MFSLTKCLQSAARAVSRPTSTSAASSSRWLSTSTTARNSAFDRTANDDLENTLRETAESPEAANVKPQGQNHKGTRQAYNKQNQITVRGWNTGQVTTVKDYRRSGRLERTEPRAPRKPWQLGPNAKVSREADVFYQLGINPLNEAMNSRLLSNFVTTMGKVRPRSVTNLTWKTQRRLGKAIRRAKMMGIIPILSRRPLVSQGMDNLLQQAEPKSQAGFKPPR
ncbi:hypothetical protein EIP86_004754 [Pleurotus ostreatoroseus]|nr:hypothetical protein EIP86_004754 [Pleurotus ostreatoroseus]